MKYKGRFVKGETTEEVLRSIDRTLTHFSRRLHKTVVVQLYKPDMTEPDIGQMLIDELDKVVENHIREVQEALPNGEQETKGIVWNKGGKHDGQPSETEDKAGCAGTEE